MSRAFLTEALILAALCSAILPLLTLGVLRGFGKKIRHRACYLILVLCAIRILLPTGIGIPTVFEFSDLTSSSDAGAVVIIDGTSADEDVLAQNATSDIFLLPSSPVQDAEKEHPFSARLQALLGTVRRYAPIAVLTVWGVGTVVFLVASILPQISLLRKEKRFAREPDPEALDVYLSLCEERGLRHVPRLCSLNCAVIPYLNGIFRPRIVLGNAELDREELRHVLSHELTHFRRGDLFVKWLLLLDLACFWWNPLVHLLVRKTQEEMEYSCDERVLRCIGEEERHAYCSAILKLLRQNGSGKLPMTVGFSAERGGGAVDRFRAILDRTPKRRGGVAVVAICVSITASAVVFGCSSQMISKPVTEVFYLKTAECHLSEEQLIEIAKTMEIPQVDGMRMTGWNVYSEQNADGSYSIRFEAAMEPEVCGVSFVVNGGDVPNVKETYSFGDALPQAVREGYTFDGWYRDAALRERVRTVPEKNCVLYAKWAEESSAKDFTFTERQGTLTVSSYRGSDTHVRVPAYVGGMAVTGVDVNCFAFCTSLVEVALPETVTTVGAGAFRYCYSLETVTFEGTVGALDRSVFEACYRLKEFTVDGERRAYAAE